MGGGGKWKKTKWRTFCPDSVGEATTPKERQEGNCNLEAENVPRANETPIENENCQFEEVVQYEDYPQDILYPQPPVVFYDRYGMPFYPNFLIPSDAMYRPYFPYPPPGHMPDESSPMYPVQVYNSSNHGPPVHEYPPFHGPPELMRGPPVHEYSSPRHGPDAQGYNSGINTEAVSYDPNCQECQIESPVPCQDNNAMHCPLPNGMSHPNCQECRDRMEDIHGREYNPMQIPGPKDPLLYFYPPGAPIHPNYPPYHPFLNYDGRQRRKRRPYHGHFARPSPTLYCKNDNFSYRSTELSFI